MKIEKLFPVKIQVIESQGKMLEVINEKIFQVLIIIPVVAGDVVENFMIIPPDILVPPLGFDNLPDFFSCEVFWQEPLGKNLFLIKLEIWERNFVVSSLILANDVFEMFQSGIFFQSGGCETFADKLGFIKFFCKVGIGIGHFLSGRKFFGFLAGGRKWEKMRIVIFQDGIVIFQDLFLVLILTEVDDNKGLLGHFQKIKSSPSKVTDFKRLKRLRNSSEEISTRGEMILRFFLFFGVSQ